MDWSFGFDFRWSEWDWGLFWIITYKLYCIVVRLCCMGFDGRLFEDLIFCDEVVFIPGKNWR